MAEPTAAVQAKRPRPLSPHLSVYRWQLSNSLSILHRMTGVALALGLLPMVAWLWGAAYAPELHTCILDMARAWYGQVLLAGWSFAYYYHLANGIRHLFWDIGKGFELPTMNNSAYAVIFASITLTAFTWYLVLFY